MRMLGLATISIATLVAATGAALAEYPERPITLVVGYPAGGGTDIQSRALAPYLEKALGQPVVVENLSGASGNIACDRVAKAPPDGYTLVMAPVTSNAIGMSTYAKLGYDLEKDLAPVSLVGNVPHILVSHPTLPARNIKELIALGKSRPDALNFASQGPGTLSHLEQELLKQMGGFKALHVPYKGSAPGIADLIAGHVVLFFDSIPSALPHVKSGRVRALGVASSTRSPALPDVPAIGESLKGFQADSWFGIMVPAGTPRELVAKLNADIQKALAYPEVKERLLAVGGFVTGGGPAELAARVKEDVSKWGKVVRVAGIKAQ